MSTITAAESIISRIAPQLRSLGASAVETFHDDTVIATFSRMSAPAAKAALRESVDGVNLLVRTEGGSVGSRMPLIDEIGSFIANGYHGPITGFRHASEGPTELFINAPKDVFDSLKQVIRDTVHAPDPVAIKWDGFEVPVA